MKRFFFLVLMVLSLPAAAASQNLARLEQQAHAFVQGELSQRPGSSFRLGRFDRRLVLPACVDPQVSWSDGAEATGNTFVDVFCIDPAWRLRLPVAISEPRFGLVLTRPMRAGDTLGPDDVRQVPLPAQLVGRDLLSDPDQVVGQTMSSGASAGIWLRNFMVRPPVVVKMNQRVKVVVEGEGFSVQSEGVSTANGRAGEVIAVRMPNGQLLRGAVTPDGSVSLSN